MGFSDRFWTALAAQIGVALIGAVLGALLTYLLVAPAARASVVVRLWPPLAAGAVGAVWGANNWLEALLWWKGTAAAVSDPILHRDASFYLFSLPFYDRVFGLLPIVALISLAAAGMSFLTRSKTGRVRLEMNQKDSRPGQRKSFRLSFASLLMLLGVGAWLKIFHLLYSDWGAVSGPG